MTRIPDLIRPHLLSLKPYASARHEFQGEASIFLDANENPFNTGFNRYPDPLQLHLKEKIAAWRGIDTASIFLGNGSDEAIDLLIRLFCRPGKDHIIVPDPSYGMYTVSSRINDVAIIKVPLDETFQLNVGDMQAHFSEFSKLLFLCSPNNPSGNCLNSNDVLSLVQTFPGVVIIDEAYIDFCVDRTMLNHLHAFENLVILQTFSKAWGLAGIRLGMAFAHKELIRWINKIKPPYNISTLTQRKALDAFTQKHQLQKWVDSIIKQREFLHAELQRISYVEHVFPSDANFILARFDNAKKRYDQLVETGIVVRDRSNVILCDECLRISVGTPEENRLLLNLLQTLAS